ncbi:MAG: DUF4383 domain-containing protein [Synechococcales bacterium]|nr:DUF4383 domain-containing protein [Synechococcales bacterium]
MKAGQYFALIAGIGLLIVGILGFVPGAVSLADPANLTVDPSSRIRFGYLLGLFPVNHLLSSLQILAGITGILTSIALDGSRYYARFLAILYGIFAVMGLFPFARTAFGLTPLFGNDVWFHAVIAAIATYYGFFASPGLLEIASQRR